MMNKHELLAQLKSATGNSNISLPSDMSFDIQNGVLTITMSSSEGLTVNMQKDAAAFEGWALCLKAWLPTVIHKVHIKWSVGRELLDWVPQERLHYERFLYRVWKFTQMFDWVTTDSHLVITNYNLDSCLVNFPQQDAQKSALNKEAQLERNCVEVHRQKYDTMNHQLPVGVFKDKIANSHAIMPAGNSQIDIWAIRENELFIFELKEDGNAKVGIISELMFYCNIMDDLMSHRINYPDDARNCDCRDFKKLYKAYTAQSISRINGVFLTNKLHPLISDAVLDLMNAAYGRIRYSHQKVDSQ
jgi:hypothetical protein